jgi:hypothetical protein
MLSVFAASSCPFSIVVYRNTHNGGGVELLVISRRPDKLHCRSRPDT